MASITAPFNEEQVKSLNAFQKCKMVHPFTCRTENCREILVATTEGFVCPKCGYTQKWCHDFMADNMWLIITQG